jgi:hypothetical protein
MNDERLYSPMRWFSHLVLLLMAVAMVYAAWISIVHWAGIGV